jgi:uncharacterized peroxidase-related enzyme
MSRLFTQAVSEAGSAATNLFAMIKQAAGKVPNAYLTMGTNSPVALEAVLNLDAALGRSSLKAREIEIIKLVVSETVGCDYCLAAHTMLGKRAGLSREAILALRHGRASDDAKNDALATFVRELATTSGTLPAEALAAVRAAGYNDAQITDIALAMAAINLTNLFNRINDTTLDFPAAE